MPRIRRHGLPPRLLDHLLDRVSRRKISADQLGLLADWLYTTNRPGATSPYPNSMTGTRQFYRLAQ
jgi:hypothetical protein